MSDEDEPLREDIYSNDTDFSDFMTEIHDHFSTLVRESYKAPKDAMEEWQGSILHRSNLDKH